ncbi:MAG TPA: MFS transporter, partial [Verrucomicrobiae bacterium]|nr:MFS transporter [Verrucomicrobiae bacterium]
GMGLCMMPVQTAGMNSVSPALVGRASALNNTVRQVNGSLGISILTTILQHRQAFHSTRYVESLNLASPQVVQAQAAAQGMFTASGLSPLTARMATSMQVYTQVIKNATVTALDDTFLVAASICFVGIPLALLIKKGVARPIGKSEESITMEM